MSQWSGKKILGQMFAFLSSVQLAVVLLLSLAAVLALGTFLESAHDTPTAQHYVYQTSWFVALLGLLGLNVFCAGMSRWPWKRHHSGFLTVHLGILIILAGSLITLFWGYEGQLIIPEGEARSRFFLKESSLYFYDPSNGNLAELPADFQFDPPSVVEPVGDKVLNDILVKADGYLENAQMDTNYIEGEGEVFPGLEVNLMGSRAQLNEWLLAREPERQRISVGPAQLNFIEVPTAEDLKKILKDQSLRGPVLWVEGRLISLKGKMGAQIPISSGTLLVKNFFPDAAVIGGTISNRSEQYRNPGALIEFQGRDQILFSKYSHVPGVLLGAESHQINLKANPLSPNQVRLFYISDDLGKGDNELVLAKTDGGDVFYSLKGLEGWQSPQILQLKKKYPTGWMDFQFEVATALNRAEEKHQFRSVKIPQGKEGPPPAVRLHLARNGQIREFWLGRGQSQDVFLGGKSIKVAYALKSKPLGFEVHLEDFILGTYQGTQDPASYESQVKVTDSNQGHIQDVRIAMNQPLKRGPYKIFQASYQLNPDGADWTVLAVAYDPGIFVKYVGAIILILGIIIIFYFRRAYFPKPQKATKVAASESDGNFGSPLIGGTVVKTIITTLMMLSPFLPMKFGMAAEVVPLQPKAGFDFNDWAAITVLDGGRKKPLDSFARETVRDITGKEKFQGFSAVEILLAWTTQTPQWEQEALIQVNYRPVAEHLGLKLSGGRVAPKSLRENPEFQLFLQTVASRQQEGARLTPLEQEGGRLGKGLQDFYRIAEGSSLVIFPAAPEKWESLAQIASRYPEGSWREATPTVEAKVAAGVQGLLTAYYQGDADLFAKISPLLTKLLRDQGEMYQEYPSAKVQAREIFFNRLNPFQWAWVGYAVAAFLLALSWAGQNKWFYRSGLLLMVLAFGLHICGFILRILISGRAPVTNMYETVIWIPFGVVLFALILESIYRSRIFALAGAAMAALGLLVAQSAPHVLDPALDPLVPVLRNNFWLTIHVLTITVSYGAFTLALGVANVNGGFYLFGSQKTHALRQMNLFIYRAMQIGVVLLAAGTILGGVWADQSWGRFWGWDPKEVWALIALLGYLAILHGRFVGWIRGVGMTVSAILAYLLVLMAWYGVNFILGVGLHSYGFSSGGAKFVAVFTSVELLWVALILLKTKGGIGTKGQSSSTSNQGLVSS